jgi:hypothetical protein
MSTDDILIVVYLNYFNENDEVIEPVKLFGSKNDTKNNMEELLPEDNDMFIENKTACPDWESCTSVSDEQHESLFFHPCPDNEQCLLMNDDRHCHNYVHTCPHGSECERMDDYRHVLQFHYNSNDNNENITEQVEEENNDRTEQVEEENNDENDRTDIEEEEALPVLNVQQQLAEQENESDNNNDTQETIDNTEPLDNDTNIVHEELTNDTSLDQSKNEGTQIGDGYTEADNDYNPELEESIAPTDRKIELEIYYGEGTPSKFITLHVVNQFSRKPFIGGYRHKVTNIEYHHASTQTIPRKKTPEEVAKMNKVKFHRETQTKEIASRTQQTYREQGTQMTKPGLALDETGDREVYVTGTYFDADMMEELRHRKAIVIQAFTRGWFARKLARRKKTELYDIRHLENTFRDKEQAKSASHKRKEIERRMQPKTKEDFDILYNQLESWRVTKTARIQESAMDEELKKKALMELLRKEIKLLQTIDRLKQTAAHETKHINIHNKFRTMADPKALANNDGGKTHIETPFTVRARELMDLYHGLNTEMLSIDERLDVLLHVKWTVKEFDCKLTRDIVELIDREADLLNRGRKDKSLTGLQKRLSNLFLTFCEQPEFNPEAMALVKIPLEHSVRPHVQLIPDKKRS